MNHRRRFLFRAGSAALGVILVVLQAVAGTAAWTQTATIRLVVPYPPGGPADILARLLGEQIGRMHGPTIVIENRAGAGGRIGTEAVARAEPDGRTLLIVANPFVIDPLLRKVNYDPLTSFEPICRLTNQPSVFVVNAASSYRTVAQFLDAARAMPGKLTLASAGPGTATQIAFAMFERAANVDVTFVPYPGAAPAANALLGAHVASALIPYTVAAQHLKAGTLRALATASQHRIAPLLDVPTLAELGYEGVEADFWNALFAAAGTASKMLFELADQLGTALQVPEVNAKLVFQGQFPVGMCGADFAAYLRKQYNEYGRIIREANIKAE
jgi:tripartite-type tricarboxylate transporter receptor subunit TctC